MARRRTSTDMTETQREEFVRAAVAFHRACTAPMSTMRTNARIWRAARHGAFRQCGAWRADRRSDAVVSRPNLTERVTKCRPGFSRLSSSPCRPLPSGIGLRLGGLLPP